MKITYFNNSKSDFSREIENFISLWENELDTITVHTSGSTGKPKSIAIKKVDMLASAKLTGHFFNFRSGEKMILSLSPNYIAGMMQIVRARLFNMELIVTGVSSNPLKGLNVDDIHFAAFVPLQVQAILNDPETRKIYGNISNVIIGGAAIPRHLEDDIVRLSNRNYATFGMTETISHIALREIKPNNLVYQGLGKVSFTIDVRGCLIINAPHLFSEPLVTNDCVELVNKKGFIWKGRIDHVINSGGIKIHPEMLESKLVGIINNRRYYIIGVNDEKFGEAVTLVIEGTEYSESIINNILDQIKTVLNKYELPKAIVFKNKFDETATGKIIKTIP